MPIDLAHVSPVTNRAYVIEIKPVNAGSVVAELFASTNRSGLSSQSVGWVERIDLAKGFSTLQIVLDGTPVVRIENWADHHAVRLVDDSGYATPAAAITRGGGNSTVLCHNVRRTRGDVRALEEVPAPVPFVRAVSFLKVLGPGNPGPDEIAFKVKDRGGNPVGDYCIRHDGSVVFSLERTASQHETVSDDVPGLCAANVGTRELLVLLSIGVQDLGLELTPVIGRESVGAAPSL